MAERKMVLPALETRKSGKETVGVTLRDAGLRITPKAQRYAGLDMGRLTQTQSMKWMKTSRDEGEFSHPASSFRSPTIQTKHEILLQLKELRPSPSHLTIKHSKSLCQVLHTLSREKGYYSDEMTFIVQQLQRVIFCHRDDIPAAVLQYIYARDVEVMLQEDGLVPFFYVTSFLYSLVEQFSDKEAEMERQMKGLTESYEDKMREKEREVLDLEGKIDVLKEGFEPVERKLKETQEENDKLLGSLKGFHQRLDKMEEKYRTAKVALKEDLRLISDLESKVKMLNSTALDASNALEALEEEYKLLEKAYLTMQDEYRNLVQKLVQMEKKMEGVGEEKRKVEEEVYHLRVRAAAGFEELTPRPSFSKIYEMLGVETTSKQCTEEHIQELTRQIRSLQLKLAQSPKPRVTRKLAAPQEGRNRSPSIDLFAEEGEET